MQQCLKVMNIFLCLISLSISCFAMERGVSDNTMSDLEHLQKIASLCGDTGGDTKLHLWARSANVEDFREYVHACKIAGYKVNIFPQRYLYSDEGLWVVCETPLSIVKRLKKTDLKNELRYQEIITIIEEYREEQIRASALSKL